MFDIENFPNFPIFLPFPIPNISKSLPKPATLRGGGYDILIIQEPYELKSRFLPLSPLPLLTSLHPPSPPLRPFFYGNHSCLRYQNGPDRKIWSGPVLRPKTVHKSSRPVLG